MTAHGNIQFQPCSWLENLSSKNKYNVTIMFSSKLEIQSCIRGHHIYKEVWMPFTGKILAYQRGEDNTINPYFKNTIFTQLKNWKLMLIDINFTVDVKIIEPSN